MSLPARCFTWLTRCYSPNVKEEFGQIFHIAWPLIMASLWSYLLSPVSIMFCGHLGTTVLDGVAIAGSLINIIGIAVVTGLSSACDTFFSQTYGSGNYFQLNVYLQRSILIIGLSLLPCWALMLNSRAFLALLHQDPEVSNVAAEYLDEFMFGLPGCFAYILLSKYLQNQNILYPTIIIGATGNAINVLLHYLLIWVASMGFDGSAYAQAIAFDAMGIMSVAYILIWKVYDKDWHGWRAESYLADWGPFMRLAVPSLLMICIEFWSVEIGVFLTALVGIVQQSSQSILFQIQIITDMFTIGLGSASSIRIGQHLGRGDPATAKLSAILCLLLTLIITSLAGAILGGLHAIIPFAFTEDEAVATIVSNLLPVLAIGFIGDALASAGGGIIRGCGRQVAGSIINMFGYYVLALPIGITLTIYLQIIDPLWYALYGALAINAIIYFILILRTNWAKEAQKAAERCQLDRDSQQEGLPSILRSLGLRTRTWATMSSFAASDRLARRIAIRPSTTTTKMAASSQALNETLLDPGATNDVTFSVGNGVPSYEQQLDNADNNSIEESFNTSLPVALEEATETTPLLKTTRSDKKEYDEKNTAMVLPVPGPANTLSGHQIRRLVAKRLVAVFICLGLLGISIILRFTVFKDLSNFVPSANVTTVAPFGNQSSTISWTTPVIK